MAILYPLPTSPRTLSFGNAAVFEDQFAGARCADAEFVFFLTDGETGKILFDDEGGNALVPSGGINGGEQNEDAGFLAVRDPELASVEDVVAALEFCLGGECKGVGTRTGFT